MENENNLPISFKLEGSASTADGSNYLSGNQTITFSQVPAGGTVEGYWLLSTTRDGYFIEFTSTLKHKNYLGIELDPLIENVTTTLVPAIGGRITQAGCTFSGLSVRLTQNGSLIGESSVHDSGAYFIPDLEGGDYLWTVLNSSESTLFSKDITVFTDRPTEHIITGFDTTAVDSDNDTMPDCWELENFSQLSLDGTGDYDEDGLTDLEEFERRTDPKDPDSDGDGLPDGWEVQYGLNPGLIDSDGDLDNDGFTDLEEYENKTDPTDLSDNFSLKLAGYYSPIIYQHVDTRDDLNGASDMITNFDYDGDWQGNNNWDNLENNIYTNNAKATVYYSIVETGRYWFLYYAIYHPRDWTNKGDDEESFLEHENDMEAVTLMVEKIGENGFPGKLLAAMSMSHNVWLEYSNDDSIISLFGDRDDDEDKLSLFMPISIETGQISGVHPSVYIQSRGHGIFMDPNKDEILNAGNALGIDNWDKTGFPGLLNYDGTGLIYYWTKNLGETISNIEEKLIDSQGDTDNYDPADQHLSNGINYELVPMKTLWDKKEDHPEMYAHDSRGLQAFYGDGENLKANAAHPPWTIPDYEYYTPIIQGREISLPGELFCDPLLSFPKHFIGLVIATDEYADNPFLDYFYDPDSDSDGMLDFWERAYFSNLSRDGNSDFDNDGLTDKEEHDIKTDPTMIDTDGDLLPDKYELENSGLNPLENDSAKDLDGDSFWNIDEFIAGTDINDPDSMPERQYGTTIITHGFLPDIGEDDGIKADAKWTKSMAEAIAGRSGNATVYIFRDGEIDETVIFGNGSGANGREGENIIVYDWIKESDKPYDGYAEAAADVLFANLVEGAIENKWSLEKLHFIGHSRGTVVNSECIQRLIYAASSQILPANVSVDDMIHMTTLDPHPWDDDIQPDSAQDNKINGENIKRGVVGWKNSLTGHKVGFIDNYHQDNWTCPGHPDGLSYFRGISTYSRDLGDMSSDVPAFTLGVVAGFYAWNPGSWDLLKFMNHSGVHAWYYGTIDPGAEDDGDQLRIWPYRLEWYGTDLSGYHRSRIGGKSMAGYETLNDELITVEDDTSFFEETGLPKLIFNGDLSKPGDPTKFNMPGWEYQGGGGSAHVEGLFNHYLQLEPLFEQRRHNKVYIPTNVNTLKFHVDITNNDVFYSGEPDTLKVYVHEEGDIDCSIPLNKEKSGWKVVDVTEFQGKVVPLTFIIKKSESNNSIDSIVRIDDLNLYADADHDCLPDSIDYSPYDADYDDDSLIDGNCGSEDLNANGILDPGETDPLNPDTDGDGILDGTERGLTEPETNDTDLSAGNFVPDSDPSNTTDPSDADTDDDGIIDGNEDMNHDGLIDPSLGETDPSNPDTDGDGIYDGTEVGLTEPQNPEATNLATGFFLPDCDPTSTTDPNSVDSDGDGISDGEEDINKDGAFNPDAGETDPILPDADNDSISDVWEMEHFNTLDRDGTGDFDHDAISDKDEFLNNTDPTSSNAPSVPEIFSPEDGTEVTIVQPELVIENSIDPDGDVITYQFEIYTDAEMANMVSSQADVAEGSQNTSWTLPVELEDNKWQYWRVRATDGKGYSEWAYGRFFVNTENDGPGLFFISSPLEGSEVDTLTPTLEVTNSTDADEDDVTYTFVVFADSEINTLVASVTGVEEGANGTTSWNVNTELNDNSQYFWKVIATDEHGAVTETSLASFFVNTVNDAPEAPMVLSPIIGTEVDVQELDLTVNNSFDPEHDALEYYFELDKVNTFDSAAYSTSGGIPEGQDSTGWHVSGLDDNTGFFWRAKSNDGNAESQWVLGRFFVNLANDPPSVPTVRNPGNGAWMETLTPTLEVNPSSDIDKDTLSYEFELYSDSSLNNQVAQATLDTTSWVTPFELNDNSRYYWRAQAKDEHGLTSGWMEGASFFVNNNGVDDPPDIRIIDPSTNLTIHAESVMIRWEDSDPDSNADIALYYDTDSSGEDGVLIVNGIKEDTDGDDDLYLWNISGVPDGTYYLYGNISDNTSSAASYAQATVNIDTIPPTVTAAPLGGTYTQTQDVILSASEPSVIYYTTDGTDPSTGSLSYTSPIEITENTTLRFMAIDEAGNQSQIAVETYTIEASPNIPPVAHAGDDFTVQLGETASPDGSASLDSDNGPGPLTFRWYFENVPTGSGLTDADISGADTASPHFIPDVAGTYVLELEVGDGMAFNYDNVSVMVEAGVEYLDNDGDYFTEIDGDCNDNDAAVNPSVVEICGDGIDNNCDGQVDEGCNCEKVTNLSGRAKLSKVQLVWTHVGADSYNVYRKTNGGEYALLANTTSTYSTYLDEGVTIGTTYSYMVKSLCQGFESGVSNEVTITPSAR